MYDELVTQCRDCIECLCGDCKYEHLQKPGNFVPCMNALLGEAADAIEELQSDNAALNGTVSNLIQQIAELSKRVPKSGVWREEESGYDDVFYECSVCGAGICTVDGDPFDNAWNYCPECGAKMTGIERLPEPPEEDE